MNPWIRLPKVPVVEGRHAIVLSKCKGKRVLHLGCVDSGLLEERFSRNELMHQRLASVASELWGIDIDEDGIAFLLRQGFQNVVVADVCQLAAVEAIKGRRFDVILASEILEHLQNPGMFLGSIHGLMSGRTAELIVTVPNAFRIANLVSLLRGWEYVHPDHNYWFSYHTITNLLMKNGFDISEVYVYVMRSQPFSHLMIGRDDKHDATIAVVERERGTIASRIRGLFKRLALRLLSVPASLVFAALFRTASFWGDGIVVVATTRGTSSEPAGYSGGLEEDLG